MTEVGDQLLPATQGEIFGPWNPGIRSVLPRDVLPLSTMFRPENVETSLDQAQDLSDFCGLPAVQLVAFRAERLVIHELLIRVTADLEVRDGSTYEDLGINFRRIANTILTELLAPKATGFVELLDEVRRNARDLITAELSQNLFGEKPRDAVAERRPLLLRLAGWRRGTADGKTNRESTEERETRAIAAWQSMAKTAGSPLEKSCYGALARMANAVMARRGRLAGGAALIADIAVARVNNEYGSDVIGAAIDPLFREAARQNGYRFLPCQARPVVMNVKGASAAGKSTIRPYQHALADRIGIPWTDFALISPDIWRKLLLDYQSLGAAYKYAGMLTGHELEVIDKKLDKYMAGKASGGAMTHLSIDRFRFDSFLPESQVDAASKLLTRFGDLVYMFFMITPPEATVERAWLRGQKFGRYKAVDDLLDHNIEAYTGMPELFFTWALRTQRRVHYEFLDNSVPKDHLPRTVAFGWNGEMNILDVNSMLDIDRFKKIDVNAKSPEDVYVASAQAPENNVDFIKQCARMIPALNFADIETGCLYARMEHGRWTWQDREVFAEKLRDPEAGAGLRAIGTGPAPTALPGNEPRRLLREDAHTIGAWADGGKPV